MTCAVAVMVAISTGLQIALTMCQPFHISSHLILRRPCEVGTVIPILHGKTLSTQGVERLKTHLRSHSRSKCTTPQVQLLTSTQLAQLLACGW